ncbi:hypothetical protein GCK72_012477 [Caenorhabditis remanei]|uniref:SH2 domain-containing protein n=1 Tax=Caenorhabditis remanei TaxID=31234 RepID=A0A6A5GMZ1_CAERE|nr:hypothetical protein GCK72_012477 [Caenorhabditis remanei]KAF1756024.1 hypothetical protein GCK72_012477 [Caenorhabditis remanei]
MDERGHLAAKFNNSKLTRIAHRKPPPKGASDMKCAANMQAATDQKYALLFYITPFQMGNLSKASGVRMEEQFDVWTLSLPIMVTVHGSQDCDAQVAILWHRAFASISRNPNATDVTAVTWDNLALMLRNKFQLFTGARRPLSESDLAYLSEKMLMPNVADQKPITFHRFAKQAMRDELAFSFWEWFFSIMQLIKQKLLKYWDEGWCIGFISKHDASQSMMMSPHSSFLLRFSDTQTGAVSIGFVCDEEGQKVPFHLAPLTTKDLDQLSLASRIASCPQLRDIRYMYPHIDKEEMLRYFESEERHRVIGPDSPGGYIQSEIVMVAKTNGNFRRMSNAPSMFGADSPSPLSIQSKLDWSPGEVHQNSMMEMADDLGQILTVSGMDSMSGDVETLLGPAFKNQITNFHPHDNSHQQHNLHFVDMSHPAMMLQPQQQQQQHHHTHNHNHNQFYPS